MINQISFPSLGINLTLNRVAFTVFGKDIYWYALIILTGFLFGTLFVAKSAKKRGINTDVIWDVALFGLISGLVGARLYYVIFDFDSVRGSFLNIFKVWEGGLAIYGGIIGATISTCIYCRKKQLPLMRICDLCCAGLFIGQAIGRWGNFINAEVYGGETTLPWGMSVNGSTPVHPLFLYESIWNTAGLLLLLFIRRKKYSDGQLFSFYILWYSLGRLFLEGMRQNQYILYLIEGRLGISQAVAAIGIALGIFGLIWSKKRAEKNI